MKNIENLEDFYTKPDSNQKEEIKNAVNRVAEAQGIGGKKTKKALNGLDLDIKGIRVLPNDELFKVKLEGVKINIFGDTSKSSQNSSIGIAVGSKTPASFSLDSINIIGTLGPKIVYYNVSKKRETVLSQKGGEDLPRFIMTTVPEMVLFKGERTKAVDLYNFTFSDAVYEFKEASGEHLLKF